MIIETLATSHIGPICGAISSTLSNRVPKGALALAIVAVSGSGIRCHGCNSRMLQVERALKHYVVHGDAPRNSIKADMDLPRFTEGNYGDFTRQYLKSIMRLQDHHWENIMDDVHVTLNQLSHIATGAIREYIEDAVLDYRARISVSDLEEDESDDNEEEDADDIEEEDADDNEEEDADDIEEEDADGRSPDTNPSPGHQRDPQSDCGTSYGVEAEMEWDDDIEAKEEPEEDDNAAAFYEDW
jgi:hypothetical protein